MICRIHLHLDEIVRVQRVDESFVDR